MLGITYLIYLSQAFCSVYVHSPKSQKHNPRAFPLRQYENEITCSCETLYILSSHRIRDESTSITYI